MSGQQAQQTDRELRARIGQRLTELLGAPASPLTVLAGGHSGLTYRTQVGQQRLVVKAVPPGRRAVGRHDMLRQARILQGLADAAGDAEAGCPVPRVFAVDSAEPAWFAMAEVPGQAIEPVLDGVELAPGLAAARMAAAVSVLAALHAVPRSRLPEDRPISLTVEVEKWLRVLRAGEPEFVSAGEKLADRLLRRVPDPGTTCLLHGDFRLGNILFEGVHPRAVVDWEIWGIGDPRVDLGYFGVFVDADNFPGVGTAVPSLPTEAEVTDQYGRVSGRPVVDAAWFAALGRFRMAAIMAHNLRRHREGRHVDDAQETLPDTINRLTETGLSSLLSAPSR